MKKCKAIEGEISKYFVYLGCGGGFGNSDKIISVLELMLNEVLSPETAFDMNLWVALVDKAVVGLGGSIEFVLLDGIRVMREI